MANPIATVEPGKKARWAEKYPELGVGPVDGATGLTPDYFEKERRNIFNKVWWWVGRTEELPKAGDYKVKRIDFANASAIVARGRDGKIRAFHNICSHRGNTVVTESPGFREFKGHARGNALVCRFHGWVYDSAGKLIHVPEEEHFPCFAKEENSLVPIACEEWNGFVFINLDPEPEQSLMEFLGGFADHFNGFPYDQITYCFEYYTMLDGNWKPCMDAFAEAYHVHTIHAGSFPNVFTSRMDHVKFFGPHRTSCAVFANPPVPQPVGDIAQKIAPFNALYKRGQSILPPQINPDRQPNWGFELACIFPSLLFHVLEGSWFTHQFWPVAHDKTLWEGKLYLPAPQKNSDRWALEQWQIIQRNAWLEDTQTMEDTYRAMASGRKKTINLHDEEVLIRHGYKVTEDWVNNGYGG